VSTTTSLKLGASASLLQEEWTMIKYIDVNSKSVSVVTSEEIKEASLLKKISSTQETDKKPDDASKKTLDK